MASFFEGATGAVRRAFCRALNGLDAYYGFYGSLGIPVPQAPPSWKNWVCDEPGPEPPPPPFEGGQCPGVNYRIFYSILEDGVVVNTNDFVVPGPINQFSRPNPDPMDDRIQEGYTFQGGETIIINSVNRTLRTDNIVRVDGMPDDCGDPIPTVPPFPPGGIEEPDTIDWDGPDGPESEPVIITINAPIIIPIIPFTLYAPVTISGPNINLTGNFEIAPEIVFRPNFGGGDSSPGEGLPPSTPENPITSPDTPDDDSEDFLMGVVVRSQPVGNIAQTELGQVNAPTLFVPRIGSVYFRTRNRNVNAWNGPHDIKTTSAYIPVPENVTAVDVRVHLEAGWTGDFAKITGRRSPMPS